MASNHVQTQQDLTGVSSRRPDIIEVTVRSLRACTRRRIKPLSCQHVEVLSYIE
ncbi:hypothetical protein QBC45DRAFT_318241 [Copromyces sp. CBS 386.78]|nr:hypothetical protein QBC45DRAFT_318241 [Copromyces sp. CBS 386.78]